VTATESSPPRNVPPTAPETVQTRQDVLRAVIALIGEHGIDGMTMRQVAQAARMSTGTINYHFNNKRGLILAALDAAQPVPVSRGAETPLERLQALFRGFVLEDDDRRHWWRFWVEVTAQAARDTDLRDRQRIRMDAERHQVEDLVALGVERGELRGDLDATLIAQPLLALAYGLAVQQLITPDAATVRRASDALEGSLREISAR